jgi:hypothetical protein
MSTQTTSIIMGGNTQSNLCKFRVTACITTCLWVLLFLIMQEASAQPDYSWWNQKHNWDGHTHWTKYYIYSPGYFGPNALPVPSIPDGRLGIKSELEFGWAGFFAPGETTLNGFSRLRYIIGKGLAAFELKYVFLEYYKTDTLLRDERFARSFDVEGFAVGDVHIATMITLVRDKKWPDMLLRVNLQTASGSKLSDARYIDAPAYYFDLIFGKDLINRKEKPYQLRLYGNMGFYAWQTGYAVNRQNDALLAGIGFALIKDKHRLSAETTGYFGYLEERDQPIVQRLSYQFNEGNTVFKLSFQKGLQDIFYNNLNISLVYVF